MTSRRRSTWFDPSPHREMFIPVKGVRLQCLDWGGVGPALMLVHGFADNPHFFDDLAPELTDRFRVVAYARRGHGRSDAVGPYDNETLTEDLNGLMSALGIATADLVGYSMGGNEITAMASRYPHRVQRVVYLDGAYDWADPDFVGAFKVLPTTVFQPPGEAMTSFDAYRSYKERLDYSNLEDMRRIEAYLRESVIVQPDGRVTPRMPKDLIDTIGSALLMDRRDYTGVRCSALAIYPESLLDVHSKDPQRRRDAVAFEERYMRPFRAKSMARVQHELPSVEIATVPGTHDDFLFTSRARVIELIRASAPEPVER